MREFVRDEIPFVLAAGTRVGALVTRTSSAFAVLAGIGAGRIAGDLVALVASAVHEAIRPEAAPLPFQLCESVAPAVGLVVSQRAGGSGGAVGYVTYVGLLVLLRWLAHAIWCGRLDHEPLMRIVHCDPSLVERIGSIGPLLIGLAVGAVLVRRAAEARRGGPNALLEGAGMYTLVPSVLALGAQGFAFEPSQPAPGFMAYAVGTMVVAGLLAGSICARRSSTPVRTALVLALLLLASWLYPLGWRQTVMTMSTDWTDRPQLLLFATPLLGIALIALAAALARRRA